MQAVEQSTLSGSLELLISQGVDEGGVDERGAIIRTRGRNACGITRDRSQCVARRGQSVRRMMTVDQCAQRTRSGARRLSTPAACPCDRCWLWRSCRQECPKPMLAIGLGCPCTPSARSAGSAQYVRGNQSHRWCCRFAHLLALAWRPGPGHDVAAGVLLLTDEHAIPFCNSSDLFCLAAFRQTRTRSGR